jgi:hypothetical protein
MDLPDGIFQLFEEHVFQQVTLRAGLKRAINVLIAVVRCEHNDSRIRKFAAYLRNGIDAAQHRHAQIHQGDVGLMLAIQLDRLLPVYALRDHFHIGDSADQ